jgi:hypothetical protein
MEERRRLPRPHGTLTCFRSSSVIAYEQIRRYVVGVGID